MKLPAPQLGLPFGRKPEKLDIDGRVALITGGAQGIGLATAQALAAKGARVVIVDVDQQGVDKAAAGISQTLAYGVRADVRDRAAMADAVAQAVERFGRLDIVVATAGVTPIPAIAAQDLCCRGGERHRRRHHPPLGSNDGAESLGGVLAHA